MRTIDTTVPGISMKSVGLTRRGTLLLGVTGVAVAAGGFTVLKSRRSTGASALEPGAVLLVTNSTGRHVSFVDPAIGVLDQLRSEEHTSELQSLTNLVCRLLLEKKKK